MIVNNPNDLIGDFIGTIPAMIELAKRECGLDVVLKDSKQVLELFAMIPKGYNINRIVSTIAHHEFDLHGAFDLAAKNNLHMIQANFAQLGMNLPDTIPKPELELLRTSVSYDYILAPFSRSLPNEQKWQQDKWQSLVDKCPDRSFLLVGSKAHDDINFVTGDNVNTLFDYPMQYIASLMKSTNYGCISVVTGISHLAHALGVPNYLFCNQGAWGKNPDAIVLEGNIQDITVEAVLNKIK